MKKFNLNYHVRVKLTDYGKDIYYHQYDKINAECPGLLLKPSYPEVDENGFSVFQLWRFMELYGPHIYMAARPVLEDLSIYINDCDLVDAGGDL